MNAISTLDRSVSLGLRAAIGRITLAGVCLLLAACGSSADAPSAPGGVASQVGAPAITQQPASLGVTTGQAASFSVAATGTAPLAYQWQRNGIDIAGANAATYALASTVLADNGAVFRAVVTNSAGGATSNTATLTVTASAPGPGTKQFGTSASDIGYGIAPDAQGNVYVTGVTTGSLDATTTANGAGDLFAVKYDSAGVKQWTRQLGTARANDSARAAGIAPDAQGNVYVAGSTSGDLDGNANAGPSGSFDLFVVKYDSAGVKQWTRQLGTPVDDFGTGIATDAQGNVYVTGYTFGSLDGNTNAGLTGTDLFVVKYDSAGAKQWTRQFGAGGDDRAFGIATDAQGNVYVTGSTRDGVLDGNVNVGGNDLFVVKYNGAGARQWTRQLGTPGADIATGIATDAQSNVYVTGKTTGNLDGNTNAGGFDLFVVKYDSAGAKQWTRQLGTPADDVSTGVATDAQGNAYVTGYTGGGLDGNANAGSDNADLFVVKYDSAGVKQWTRQLGTPAIDVANGITTDAQGHVYVTGNTTGNLDGNTNAGLDDVFVVKYDSAGVKQ